MHDRMCEKGSSQSKVGEIKVKNSSKPKKRVSKKIETLQESLKAEQSKSEDYLKRLKYLQADFENYRRRVERDLQDMTQHSNERLVANIVTILDDLENAISAGKTTKNKGSLLEGVEMVYKKLDKLLEKEGLQRIESVGKPFNPNLHEVLMQIPTDKYEEGTVIEEVRKGFKFKGRIIRPSVVKLATKIVEDVKK
jgi:molecular chaperone GrpE